MTMYGIDYMQRRSAGRVLRGRQAGRWSLNKARLEDAADGARLCYRHGTKC